jgi:hypothetical protein
MFGFHSCELREYFQELPFRFLSHRSSSLLSPKKCLLQNFAGKKSLNEEHSHFSVIKRSYLFKEYFFSQVTKSLSYEVKTLKKVLQLQFNYVIFGILHFCCFQVPHLNFEFNLPFDKYLVTL